MVAESILKLVGPTLHTHKGAVKTAEHLAGKKFVALYFSAHWYVLISSATFHERSLHLVCC